MNDQLVSLAFKQTFVGPSLLIVRICLFFVIYDESLGFGLLIGRRSNFYL